LKFLNDMDFFSPQEFPKDAFYKKDPSHDTVILFLTNACNLECNYCYASSGEYDVKTMPWEIAEAGINFVVESVKRDQLPSIHLGFHGGGEPTLGMDILKKSCGRIQAEALKNDMPFSISGAFNGCWPDSITDYVIENFTQISVSFDGIEAVQNAQRPAKNCQGSFGPVTNTLYALDDACFPYGIRMTVTKDSVDRLYESICFICDEFRPQKIQAEPVFDQGRAHANNLMVTDFSQFADAFIKGRNYAASCGIELFYSGAQADILSGRFCTAACRALVVTPDGDITTCFEIHGKEHPLSDLFLAGHYQGNGRFAINYPKLMKHVNRTVQSISACSKCFCRWHCAGDCATKNFSSRQFSNRCLLNRELTARLIMEKIKAGGGFIWNGSKDGGMDESL